MADILIRGMEMPTNVFDCPLNSFGICNLAQDETHCDCIGDSRPEWCPIAPLPEGHGRLGDLDALINELHNLLDKREKDAAFSGDRGPSVTWNDAICSIFAAPIIVPAEGGTEDA